MWPPCSGWPAKCSPNDYAANFADFLAARPKDKPFCFWYGGNEPHRSYEDGSGVKAGKKLADIPVPPFLPDHPVVRSDIADYLTEIEWFDRHLGRMLEALEKAGELNNTIVIVTSDNGMPFPHAKANCYEYGIHMPLAVSWPARAAGGRRVDDVIGFVDVTATILDAGGVTHPAIGTPLAPVGRSFLPILTSTAEGLVDQSRARAFSARERHSSSRPDNLGYPQRAVRTARYLFVRNFHPERWPAGDPRKLDANGQIDPMHGAYHDIDDGPTLGLLAGHAEDARLGSYLQLAVAKRPAEELFDIVADPGCLKNLAGDPAHEAVRKDLAAALATELKRTGDPRLGDNPEIWETYKRYSEIRQFPRSP